MKIAFVNDLIYAYATGAPLAVGGAERQQWLLAQALAKAGWQVTVGVRQPLELNKKSRIEEVEFVGIGQKRFLWSWYRFLITERPDWWYWRCASHLLGIAVIIAKLARVRMIFAAGFDSDVDVRHALFQRPRWWPLFALGLEWTDKIFVQNDKQLVRLPRRWQAKTRKVPSITPEPGALIPHAQRARYVAWVAMLRKFKRPELLIEIARKTPDLRFVVCGGATSFTAASGYGEEMIRSLKALPNVQYRGQVAPAEALQVISEAAVFLSTSDEEGFPNTFLQAWSAGTPVVSLRIDPDQIIERYALGMVSSMIERAIADIRNLTGSPEAREAVASRARQYVGRNHSPSTVVKIVESATGRFFSEAGMQEHTANPV